MPGRLNGKKAIVTGGNSGIGAAIARSFAAEGATVAIVDIAVSPSSKTSTDGLLRLQADVADEAASEAAFDQALSALGDLDCLVTAAGNSNGQGLLTTTLEAWEEIMALNLRGSFLWARSAARHMIAQNCGNIIFISSQLAANGGRNNAAYIASKGAIKALTRTVALELAPYQVRVNSLAPGATETPLLQRSQARQSDPEAARQASLAHHPLGRFATPEDIAGGALYLASDDAAFVTGTELVIDGGWRAA